METQTHRETAKGNDNQEQTQTQDKELLRREEYNTTKAKERGIQYN